MRFAAPNENQQRPPAPEPRGRSWGEERGAVSAGSEELGGRALAAREAHVGRARTEMRAISAQSRRKATKSRAGGGYADDEWALIGRIESHRHDAGLSRVLC